MNTYKSIFNLSVISLILSMNTLSFGMIVRYKNEETRKALNDSTKRYSQRIINHFIDKERKELEALPPEEQTRHNLETIETLYTNQNNPSFVLKKLRTSYVPIVLLDAHAPRDDNNKKDYFVINPYTSSFYSNFCCGSYVVANTFKLHEQRLNEVEKTLEKQNVIVGNLFSCSGLKNSALFGTDQNIIQEINNDREDPFLSIVVAIHYPNEKNNALELLCLEIKKEAKYIESGQELWYSAYSLLRTSATNKAAFKVIACKDPYNINRALWKNGDYKTTMLEYMLTDKKFDEENIRIFIEDGFGMTTQEVEMMHHVGRILNKEKTAEETDQRRFWEQRIGMAKYDQVRFDFD